MTLQQHIEELRAELHANYDPKEIRQIEAELKVALKAAGTAGNTSPARPRGQG